MDRGNTKREILEASLELFSVQGFEATSISQTALRRQKIRCSAADDLFRGSQVFPHTPAVSAGVWHYGEELL